MNDTTDSGSKLRPTRFPWPPALLAGTILAAWALSRAYRIPWPGVDDQAARVVGYALGLAGIALFTWAMLTLRASRTTVLPNQAASTLVTDGPFRYRRNPIYLAEILILLGLAELTKNIWFVVLTPVFALLVTWLAILPEERHLEARFGEAYRAYKERTRRLI